MRSHQPLSITGSRELAGTRRDAPFEPPVSAAVLLQPCISATRFAADGEDCDGGLGRPGHERQLFSIQADTAAYEGQFQRSRKFRQQAVESCLNYALNESAAAQVAAAAMQESDVGNFKEAQQLAAESLKLGKNKGRAGSRGSGLRASGQHSSGAGTGGRTWPSVSLPHLGAAVVDSLHPANIATQQGDGASAVEMLQKTTPVELGNPNGEMDDGLELRPVYARGQAYLRLIVARKRRREFRKILDHPGLVGGSAVAGNTVVALARLGLARAYVLRGDTAKARTEYEQFLNLWKERRSGRSDLQTSQGRVREAAVAEFLEITSTKRRREG